MKKGAPKLLGLTNYGIAYNARKAICALRAMEVELLPGHRTEFDSMVAVRQVSNRCMWCTMHYVSSYDVSFCSGKDGEIVLGLVK